MQQSCCCFLGLRRSATACSSQQLCLHTVQWPVRQQQAHSVLAMQAQYGEKAFRRPVRDAGDGLDPNSIPVDVNAIPLGSRAGKQAEIVIPDVEWWDAALLPGPKDEQQYEISEVDDGSEVSLVGCAWQEPAARLAG